MTETELNEITHLRRDFEAFAAARKEADKARAVTLRWLGGLIFVACLALTGWALQIGATAASNAQLHRDNPRLTKIETLLEAQTMRLRRVEDQLLRNYGGSL